MKLSRGHSLAGAISLIFLAVFMVELATGAEVYQWVDENGSTWFADSLDKVPPEYRAWAYRKRKNVQEGPSISTPVHPKSETVTAPEPSKNPRDPDVDWHERLNKARAELDKLKAQRQKAQAEYEDIVSQRMARLSPIDSEKMAKAATNIKELEQRIRDKEYEITVTIPDEARQAGVPPRVLSQ